MIDLLIIGSGGAALSAALAAKKEGLNILVVSEKYPTNSQTSMAQGGINAALSHMDDDSTQQHIDDTIKASGNLASKKMVTTMCKNALSSIKWLDSIGVPFSRTSDDKISQRRLGGVSNKRACYSQDFSGLKILHTLYDQCLKENITFLNERFLLNLCVDNNIIHGATFLNIRTTEIECIDAKSVILATGGYSAIYYGFTTNADQSTGDGIVSAFNAGAKISNMEFIQFHPTGLKNSGILISESARGAGGYLVNQEGERFIDELKPRDIVSRAIYNQLQNNNRVFLDIRHLGEELIDEMMPQERKLAITYQGVDPVNELIEIAPVAHYSMGGVDIDENFMTSINGLFAIGECANAHVHGANRLGGNSLLEIISFGQLSGKKITQYLQNQTFSKQINSQLKKDSDFIEEIFNTQNRSDFYKYREELGEKFYKNVGIIRDEKTLLKASEFLDLLERESSNIGIFDKSKTYNTNLIEFLKFKNTLTLSKIILDSALYRKESRGAHFREDYPNLKDEFQKETLYYKNKKEIKIELKEVLS
jgi:succinate dehydrogenase / fumarate reductase flavoprotein subunit